MRDRRKDEVEFIAAQAAEGMLGLLPGGSLLGKSITVPLEIASRRRTERILGELCNKIDLLHDSGRLEFDWSELLESESFMSGLHLTMRAAQETESEQKRELLRNALLNGVGGNWGSHGADFLKLVVRYEPEHVLALKALRESSGGVGHWVRDAESIMRESLGENPSQTIPASRFGAIINQLVADALLQEELTSEVGADGELHPADAPNSEPQPVFSPKSHSLTLIGLEFLGFIADPLEVDARSSAPPAPSSRRV